jgi:hypothetical protein
VGTEKGSTFDAYTSKHLFIYDTHMNESQKNSIWSMVFVAGITGIIVGGATYWWSGTWMNEISSSQMVVDIQPVQFAESKDVVQNITKDVSEIKQGYGYDSPQWNIFVADIEQKTGEMVTSFFAPESPVDASTLFFSTSGDVIGTGADMKSANTIYSYNIKTGAVSNIYTEQQPRVLRTMGIDGTKLIVMYDVIDNSPGPCFSIWSDWDDFGYLDVTSVGVLKPYSVPEYQIQKGRDEQKTCKEEMSLSM